MFSIAALLNQPGPNGRQNYLILQTFVKQFRLRIEAILTHAF